MATKQDPGRAFTLAAAGLGILFLLAVAVLVLAGLAFRAGQPIGDAMQAIGIIAGCVGAVAGGGNAMIAWRDGKTGGLTGSRAHTVLASQALNRRPAPGPGSDSVG